MAISSVNHIAYIDRKKDSARVRIYAKAWPEGVEHKDSNFVLGELVMQYETHPRGAANRVRQELQKLG